MNKFLLKKCKQDTLRLSFLSPQVNELSTVFLLWYNIIIKNKSYLIGRAIPEKMKDDIIEFLEKDTMIEKVIDFKSAILDIGVYRIKCEVEITGSALLNDAYRHTKLHHEFEEVKNDFEEFKRFCVDYANRIPRLIGKHIDVIETKLTKKFPAVRHIDIEIN